MIANHIGKGLVLMHTLLSVLALSCAAGMYLQFIDWGWKEPRQELDYRVASHFDKRSAALQDELVKRDILYNVFKPAPDDKKPEQKPVQIALREAEEAFAQNRLWYDKELARLKSDPNPIVNFKEMSEKPLELDSPGKKTGKPLMNKPAPDIAKSLASYRADLDKIAKEAAAVSKERDDWIDKTMKITRTLNGIDPDGKKARTGLYDLVEEEGSAQAQIRFEMDYLEPIWVNALKESEVFGERKRRLLEAIARRQPR